MPGWQGNQLSLVGSPLDPLIPVIYDESQPAGWGSRTPSHFALTELGRRSLLTKLADTQDDNMQVWENLPGFQWHTAVTRAKAGTDVLAVHQESANEYGRVPLLVTRTFGAGKVLFMEPMVRGDGDAAWKTSITIDSGTGRPLDGLPAQHGQGRSDAILLHARTTAGKTNGIVERERHGEKWRATEQRQRYGSHRGSIGTN